MSPKDQLGGIVLADIAGTTNHRYSLYKGPFRPNGCHFTFSAGIKVTLERLESDVIIYSPEGFSIGGHRFRYEDLKYIFPFTVRMFDEEAGWLFMNAIGITHDDGREFVVYSSREGLTSWSTQNARMAELLPILNASWIPVKRRKFGPTIKKTILDLSTRFSRLQVAEIAEACKIRDAFLIIEIVQDLIAKHEIDAQYFASTQSIAFNQLASPASQANVAIVQTPSSPPLDAAPVPQSLPPPPVIPPQPASQDMHPSIEKALEPTAVPAIPARDPISKEVAQTLLLIALQQPIPLLILASRRGPNAFEHVHMLEERGFVRAEGKGEAMELVTTDDFAAAFGLNNNRKKMQEALRANLDCIYERIK